MKKLIAILLTVIAMMTLLTACGKFTCDLCNEEKGGKRYESELWGEKIDMCKDCYQTINDIADAFK